jgi:hypothetical protein
MNILYILAYNQATNACDEYCKKGKHAHLNASNVLLKWKGSFWIWTLQATHISIFVVIEGQGKEGLVGHVWFIVLYAFLMEKLPNHLIWLF